MKIRAGSADTNHGGCKAEIREVIKHPKWSVRAAPNNDIAVGILDRSLEFGATIDCVKIPARPTKVPTTDDVDVTSWGAIQQDGMFPTYRGQTLQVYCSHLYSRRACNGVITNYGVRVTENFICVSQRAYRAPCTRDSGAPAVSGGILYGLASWGIRKPCGKERYPAVFSYVGSVENWTFITTITKNFTDRHHIKRHPPSEVNLPNLEEVSGSHETVEDYNGYKESNESG